MAVTGAFCAHSPAGWMPRTTLPSHCYSGSVARKTALGSGRRGCRGFPSLGPAGAFWALATSGAVSPPGPLDASLRLGLTPPVSRVVLPARAAWGCFSTGAKGNGAQAPAPRAAREVSLVSCAGRCPGTRSAPMRLLSRWPKGLLGLRPRLGRFFSPGGPRRWHQGFTSPRTSCSGTWDYPLLAGSLVHPAHRDQHTVGAQQTPAYVWETSFWRVFL